MNEEKKPGFNPKTLITIIFVIIVIVVYAWAIDVTRIDLSEPLDANRQARTIRVIRDLAHPDLFTYDNETRTTNISIRMPCPEEVRASQVAGEGRVLRLDPNCASTTQDPVTARGTGFEPQVDGVILWFPVSQSSFHIERSPDGESWSETGVIAADNFRFVDDKIDCGSEYFYRVRTFKAIDDQFSPYSEIMSGATDDCGLTGPEDLAAESSSEDTIALSWSESNAGGDIISLQRSLDGISWDEIARLPLGEGEFIDEGLACDTTYQYRIRSESTVSGDVSAYSQVLSAGTSDCEAAAPAELAVTSAGQNQIDLQWDGDAAGDSSIVIERSLDGSDWTEVATLEPGLSSYSDTDLGCNTEYFYRVHGILQGTDQNTRNSEIQSATTAECTLAAATDFSGAGVSQFQADLSWTDNNNGTTQYLVEQAFEEGEWMELATTTAGANSLSSDDLSCGLTYRFRIRAVAEEGERQSPPSDEITLETFACSDEPPQDLTVSTLSQEAIELNWEDVTIIETTTREIAEFKTDEDGNFIRTFTMPDIREHDEAQRLAVVEILDRSITGLSDTVFETLRLIAITILMALMASTLGTVLAVPISFLGARNLMADIGTPLAAIMAALIALPIGAYLGLIVGRQINRLVLLVTDNLVLDIVGLIIVALVGLIIWRVAFPRIGTSRSRVANIVPGLLTLVLAGLLLLGVGFVADVGMTAGSWIRDNLGLLGFIGNFIFIVSDLTQLLMPFLVAFGSALAAASFASRYGQDAVLALEKSRARVLTIVLTVLGTSLLVFGVVYSLNWICLLGMCHQLPGDQAELIRLLLLIAVPVGIIAGVLAVFVNPDRPFPVGLVIYTVTRTILNTLRAIEPLIMGIVFVVWVGIGPFAGILALMLHSIADLGKLFSEQVENISEGPVEAVTATGASRVQVVTFAVIPQIVPHYIAFIFYRWDINVRMSTVIGFVGGGGIGMVLIRYTNLTLYQKAAVMVIAIAVVVTTLDYISSRIRRRII